MATKNITHMMREAILDLMEPIRFGQALANRILGESEDDRVKSLLTFTERDYQDICLKMKQLMNDVMHQRDLWKDRFFFYAIHVDEDELCKTCKEEMRQAFFDSGDQYVALRWRPGNRKGACVFRNCKYFARESFEDEFPSSEPCNEEFSE